MKKTALFLCLFGSLFFACSDGGSIENDADRLAELACEGEKTTDSERKQELKNQYAKLDKEIKVKYKNRDGDALHLADLYFKKLNDCLGYTPPFIEKPPIAKLKSSPRCAGSSEGGLRT